MSPPIAPPWAGQPNPLMPHGFGGGTPEVTQPGMSPGAQAAMGGIAMLGGGLLNYYGQRRGAESMEDEASRQAELQTQFTQARRQSLVDALARYNPATRQTAAGVDTTQRMQAANPALAAGGKALGVSAGAVGQPLLATQRLAGQRAGGVADAREMGKNLTRMGLEQGQIDDGAQFTAQLAGQSIANKGAEGAQYRLAGEMLQGAGMPLLANAMAQPTQPNTGAEWTAASEGGGSSGFSEVGLHQVDPPPLMTHNPGTSFSEIIPGSQPVGGFKLPQQRHLSAVQEMQLAPFFGASLPRYR